MAGHAGIRAAGGDCKRPVIVILLTGQHAPHSLRKLGLVSRDTIARRQARLGEQANLAASSAAVKRFSLIARIHGITFVGRVRDLSLSGSTATHVFTRPSGCSARFLFWVNWMHMSTTGQIILLGLAMYFGESERDFSNATWPPRLEESSLSRRGRRPSACFIYRAGTLGAAACVAPPSRAHFEVYFPGGPQAPLKESETKTLHSPTRSITG